MWKKYVWRRNLTEEESAYLETPRELNVKAEILNGLMLSSMGLMGEQCYKSIASAINNQLQSHLPTMCAFLGLRFGAPLALKPAIDRVLDKLHLTQDAKAQLKPWLMTLGRLIIGCTPKVSASSGSIHYHYPSWKGYSWSVPQKLDHFKCFLYKIFRI